MRVILRQPATHAAKLERWLGSYEVARLSLAMREWYGPPIHLLDTPGSVRVTAGGDFIGEIGRGKFSVGLDWAVDRYRRMQRLRMLENKFSSISHALARASAGYRNPPALINKGGPTGVVGVTSSLWRLGPQPPAGAAPGNAPGGTAFDRTSVGAIPFTNAPANSRAHLVGADVGASVINNTLLLYDLLFGVNKTINSTATEAVTGVPTRYQNQVAGSPLNPDYIGGNFLFVQVGGTALAATAHNWTVCTYTDQDGTTGISLPSLVGNSGAIIDRLDHPAQQFFAPLASGDVGIKALTQMQCSALVATGVVWFMIGHPIGFMSFPVINSLLPFDWLTNRDQAPVVLNDACLALLEITKPTTTSSTYGGMLYVTYDELV